MVNNVTIYSPHLLGEQADPLFQQINSQAVDSTQTIGTFTVERNSNWFEVKNSENHELFHTSNECYDFLKSFS